MTFHVHSDPSIIFFSRERIPFITLSLAIFLVTIIPLTLLLALYPVRNIWSVLIKYLPSSHITTSLNIFVEKFYSCFRDGLNGGKDMRTLASLYFFLRLMNYLMFTINLIPLSESYTFVSILLTGCSLMVAIIQPYKKSFMNSIDSLILANIGLIALLLDKYSGKDNGSIFGTIYLFVASFMATLPMVVMIGFVSYKFIKKSIKWIPTVSIK